MESRSDIDLEHLLKLRVVVARVGEMDLARWWNTNGQLGRYGAAAVRRGLPRTHWFAQARSVAAVAAHRCAAVFDPPGSVTLWRLPDEIEERYEARWEHWLDEAGTWDSFFEQVAATTEPALATVLNALGLVSESSMTMASALRVAGGARSLQMPSIYASARADLELLALGFSLGAPGALVVPYARVA